MLRQRCLHAWPEAEESSRLKKRKSAMRIQRMEQKKGEGDHRETRRSKVRAFQAADGQRHRG